MKSLIFLVVVMVVIVLVMAFLKGQKGATGGKGPTEAARAKPPLTEREIGMFFKLSAAFPQPEFVVLSQVSFSALLTAKSRASRNSFDRKTADFVICDKSFKVMAAIELDDASHNGRDSEDATRDRLLTDAGYRVLRYKQIPDAAKLASDMKRA